VTLRLILADDHRLVREGIRALLESGSEFEVVGQAVDGDEVADLVDLLHPDVVVLDVMMPGKSGLEVTRSLAQRSFAPPVLILSMHDSPGYVVEAMRSGAAGYALKQAPAAELAKAVRAVAAGVQYLSPSLTERALDAYVDAASTQPQPHDALTAREREVVQLAAEGNSNAEIASRLFISRRTVETHRAHAMKKLGVHSHGELVLYAVRHGIVAQDG
jgi:DNA-binding NarL/FixJ family response regulator